MRRLVETLIYRKWFYGFLAVALWLDSVTDVADLLERRRTQDVVSLVLSLIGAVLVTVVFVDLHWRWPPPEGR